MQTRPTTHHCCSTMTTRNGQTRRARCIRRPRLAPRGSAASRPTHSPRCPRPAARTATRSSSKRARNGRLSCFTHDPHPPLRPAQVCPYPRSRQPTRPDHHAGAPLISCNGQPHASAVSAVLLTTPNRRTHTRSDQAQVCPYHSPHQFTRPDRHVGALPIPRLERVGARLPRSRSAGWIRRPSPTRLQPLPSQVCPFIRINQSARPWLEPALLAWTSGRQAPGIPSRSTDSADMRATSPANQGPQLSGNGLWHT